MTSADAPRPTRQNGGRKGPWSHAEIKQLKRMYGMYSDAQIAKRLNRTPQSVKRMVHKVFTGNPVSGPWTAAEVRDLKNCLGAAPVEKIIVRLRRSEAEVRRMIKMLRGEIRDRPWTSRDIQELKRLYGTRATEDLSLILGRSDREIDKKADELCLAKDKGFVRRKGTGRSTMPRWQPEQIELLEKLYPDTPNLEIARIIGRTEKSVVSKAHDLGLRKSPERLREMGQQNVAVRYDGGQELEEA